MKPVWYVRLKLVFDYAQKVKSDSREEAIEEVKKNAEYWLAKGGKITVIEAKEV